MCIRNNFKKKNRKSFWLWGYELIYFYNNCNCQLLGSQVQDIMVRSAMQIHTKGKKNENRRIEGKYKGKKQKDKE